ncbi:MAG: sulfur carrier protein ThiS [Bacteroidales bacterium]|nr:sulfur carrier protein ThiS [Bacteroidales bacterium]
MKFELNHKIEEIQGYESISVKELLEQKKFSFKLLVVKINGKLVPREAYEHTYIHDGDKVMVLHLISGG